MSARAKVTIPNTMTYPDQDHDYDQGPVLVILEARGTIMVTILVIMTPGEGNGHVYLLPSLIQVQTVERPPLKPNLLLFNIKLRLLSQSPWYQLL